MEVDTYWFQALILDLIGDLYWYSSEALENVRTERSIWEIKYNYKRFDNHTSHVLLCNHSYKKRTRKYYFGMN